MTRHSKNNSSLGHFTAFERSKLDYGTKKQRLGKDSLRNFYDCYLCLQRARSPMCCRKGHISCKECVLESILAQNREIDRQKKALATQQAQLATEASEKTSLGVERNVEAFARTQLNFSDSTGTKKRKAEDFAKPALPSFWLPSLTPNARPDILTVPATDTLCTAVDPGHKISMKKLVPVQFTGATEKETDEPSYSCPSCTKTLTNGSSISVILSCGHVLCGECMGRFVVESKRCFVCEKKCEEKDIVELKSAEGTGYSGVGRAEATKVGMGFQ